MSRWMSFAVAALVASFSVGCAPTLNISRLKPGPIRLGAAKQLSVVQFEGRRKARDQVLNDFVSQVRARGYYKAKNRLDDGIVVQVKDGVAEIQKGGKDTSLAHDEVAFRLEVAEWNMEVGAETVEEKDKDGKVIGQKKVDFYNGELVLLVTAFNGKGKTFLDGKEYIGRVRVKTSTDDALREASSQAISRLVGELTPYPIVEAVRVDNDDDALHPMLELAEKGDVRSATEQLAEYVKDHPDNASALYNLAVFHDVSGNYPKAVELYDRAIALANKEYYLQMRSACERRMFEAQALAE
jgi:hypothetical protein